MKQEQEMQSGQAAFGSTDASAAGQGASLSSAAQMQQMQTGQTQAFRRAREEIEQFVALFPEVKESQVPQEVWQAVRAGENLSLAYAMWRMKALENALMRRNRNAELSAGSVSSAGSATLGGTVASFWDAYEV